ncbi:MAG: antibiotic ABC transporter permease [delta proteobacterium ML8_D]|jgi:ABC-2 type transport system permease protein|nr:MAG: antibiotic ABC transporter permease [delta proteobacterium ML8_D]
MRRRVIALIKKEFLVLMKDKKSRLTIIIPPILQLLIFGYAATYDLERVRFAVYDEDRSHASRDLVSRFSGSPTFQLVSQITRDEQIAPLIDNKNVLLIMRIGPQFSRDLYTGRGTNLQIIIDGRNSNTALIVLNYVRTILTDFNMDWITRHNWPTPPASLHIRSWYNENLESRWFIVPGIIGLLTLVVTMVVTALSVAREREQGTFDQLLVTPLRPFELLLGKALPGFIIGIFEATLIILIAMFWFDIPLRGNLLALYIGLVLFLLSAIGVGLMISSLALTQQQGLMGAFIFLVPSVILSGFTTPIANMPVLVQKLTLLNPLRYFMIVIRGVFLEEAPVAVLLDQYWPMALIGGLTMLAAAWLFRHRTT